MATWLFLVVCLSGSRMRCSGCCGWQPCQGVAEIHTTAGVAPSPLSFLFPSFSLYYHPLSSSISLFSLLPLTLCPAESSTLPLPVRRAFIVNAWFCRPNLPGKSCWGLLGVGGWRELKYTVTLVSQSGLRAEASRKSFTCQLSVRRQPVPPRHCPCHRGVTRL